MKYEEIKIGDVFTCLGNELTVVSKNDKYRFVATINYEETPTVWSEDELHQLKPLKEQLPEEGLLASKAGSLVYKLPDGSGYGFANGSQSGYYFNNDWGFDVDLWKPATQEQKTKFIEMLKKECENRGLFEDTKLSKCGINNSVGAVNKGIYGVTLTSHEAWNKNGRIFYKGEFAKPLKEETTLELVSKTVKEIGDFIVEQTESGLIILTPIKK